MPEQSESVVMSPPSLSLKSKSAPELLTRLVCDVQQAERTKKAKGLRHAGRDAFDETNVESKRVVPILDTIASVLVSQWQSEIIAVGLQKDPGKNVIILKIACNIPVAAQTKKHCDMMWDSLQIIGNLYKKDQVARKLDPESMAGIRSLSPPLPKNPSPALQAEIAAFEESMYDFSFQKSVHKIFKVAGSKGNATATRAASFSEWVKGLTEKELRALMQNPTALLDCLKLVCLTLDKISTLVEFAGGKYQMQSDTKISQVVEYMGSLYKFVQDISRELKDRGLTALDSLNGPGYSVSQYLEKIQSFLAAIAKLLRFANSPRMRHLYLDGQILRVCDVSKHPQSIWTPISYKKWKGFAEEALEAGGTDMKKYPDAEPGKRCHKNCKNGALSGRIHCECSVVIDLIVNESLPTIPYIGMSKLSCLPCTAFFKALRALGHKYHTRGSHNKAYLGWKYPGEELECILGDKEPAFRTHLNDSLCKAYAKGFMATQRARSDSDSSAPEPADRDSPWPHREERIRNKYRESKE